jgi:hypothetical protein
MGWSAGQLVAEPIEALPYYGHAYRTATNPDGNRLDLLVDEAVIEFEQPTYVDSEAFLGFNPDGNFAVAVNRYDPNDPAARVELFVHYYDVDGRRLGVSRLRPNFIMPMFNQDLAFGPGGQVYQLVSTPDHSVEIVRLGFTPEEMPPPATTPTPTLTPMAPLLPTWPVLPSGAGEEQQAREALLAFFALLAEDATRKGALFGGDYASTPYGPPGDDLGAWWQMACGSMRQPAGSCDHGGEQTGPEAHFLRRIPVE